MRAYRVSVNLKLGLVLSAVVIAVASLIYTHRLADQLRERDQFIIRMRARAQESVSAQIAAETGGDLTLEADILREGTFGIPAVIIDSTEAIPVSWQNVDVPDRAALGALGARDSARAVARLYEIAADMARTHPSTGADAPPNPIPIVLQDLPDGQRLVQYIFYDESQLIKELRVFPYVQLLFVGLFILIGYLGFSYVRRSEQGSLWVGMAKEAAHQLGTPISSLMGWLELLRIPDLAPVQRHEALGEVEKDIERLRRVTSRFSDIGSLPKLKPQPLAPVVGATADYIRRRIPQQARRVTLETDVPADLQVPLNAELFEWVIENLLKNALDAIETEAGHITIAARQEGAKAVIDVTDTGKGIDRRQWKNVFRPGYSTKKRGWGLGLSLAKRIVEDYHGGTLALVQSRPGYGTTFRIELPLA